MEIHLSNYFNIEKGHKNLDFADINLERDTKLFIDPYLIKFGSSDICKEMAEVVQSFEIELFESFRAKNFSRQKELFAHSSERNETKFGYGNGRNGRGNSISGMQKAFVSIKTILEENPNLNSLPDLVILVKDFSKDGLSDLLANLLYKILLKYTKDQIEENGVAEVFVKEVKTYTSWDTETRNWKTYREEVYTINGEMFLLVPKYIVRNTYLFGIDKYLRNQVIEYYQTLPEHKDANGKKIPKKTIIDKLSSEQENWKYNHARSYAKENYDSLKNFHQHMKNRYHEIGELSDEKLDEIVYGKVLS